MAKHYHCPVNGWDCPYFAEEEGHYCLCKMENPYDNCEDFYAQWEGSTEEEYTDYDEDEDEDIDPYVISDPMRFY